MVVFLVQALILVYALMRAIHYWHGNYRDLREDRWGYACAELRQAYHSMDYAPLWRRIVLWPYRYYRISTLRAEVRGPGDHPSHCLPRSTLGLGFQPLPLTQVRLFMLRERFVYQGHSTTAIHSEPLPDMFNFAAYLRRRGAYMTGEILDMTPLTWLVVGIFLVLAVQSLVVLEVEVGHDPNYVEGCTMEVGSWILLIGTLTLFHRLSWTVEQITPPHPLLKGPDDDEEPGAGAAEQTAEEQKMDPEAGSPGKWIHQTISPPVIADTAGAASEANIGDRLGNIVRDTAGVIQGVEEAPSAFTKVSDGERPDRKWVQAEAPCAAARFCASGRAASPQSDRPFAPSVHRYEKRPAKKGVSKMESLFPFGHRGPGFYIFVIRVLFFSSAIMLTLCVQWLPRAPSTNVRPAWPCQRGQNEASTSDVACALSQILLIRVFLSLVPLIAILLFGPGRLLPLMVMVTSLEQFKDRRDLHDTAIEMKTESSLQTLRVLSVILSEASRAKKIAESLEKDDPGKRKPRRCLTGIMTTEDKSQKSLSKTSQKKKAVRAELNQQQLAELRTTFNLFDKDSSGDIDKGEFEQLMNTLGLRLPPHVLDGMFEEMDLSGDGHCEFEEFVDYMIEHGFASKEADGPDHIVKVMFDILDKDHSGTISTAELRQMMIDFGGNLTHQEIDIAMGMFDLDGSGQISKAEFRKAVDAMHTFAGSKHESHRTVVMTEHGRESGAAL